MPRGKSFIQLLLEHHAALNKIPPYWDELWLRFSDTLVAVIKEVNKTFDGKLYLTSWKVNGDDGSHLEMVREIKLYLRASPEGCRTERYLIDVRQQIYDKLRKKLELPKYIALYILIDD